MQLYKIQVIRTTYQDVEVDVEAEDRDEAFILAEKKATEDDSWGFENDEEYEFHVMSKQHIPGSGPDPDRYKHPDQQALNF